MSNSEDKLETAVTAQFSRQIVRIASCNLNQWALDFDGNLQRVKESIRIAKEKGCKYRVGPELELSGYSCEDHFLEMDTYLHCEQSLAAILLSDLTDNILCEIGLPMLFHNVRYNCRVYCFNRKILLIRPKCVLADDGNYREKRYFASWSIENTQLSDFVLSEILRHATGQYIVPIGIAVICTRETRIAAEVCEELWAPRSPHINFFLSGVEIISNGSGSHHELRKLDSRIELMKNATRKCGGCYVYANHRGCDGTRLYFDGCSLISLNGDLLAQASQFSLLDVEVVTADIDLESIRTYRGNVASLQEQASRTVEYPRIDVKDLSLLVENAISAKQTPKVPMRIHSPEEECCSGPACWLYDYLRRSGASGFLLPLSGGADSSSVASIVRVMCVMMAEATMEARANPQVEKLYGPVLETVERFVTIDEAISTPQELANALCNQILHTIYMGTANSSVETRNRAEGLANAIHSYHTSMTFDTIIEAVLAVFSAIVPTGQRPRFESQGGTKTEDLSLQNLQARLRMVIAYLCGQLFPWVRGKPGFLLVLGSANVDEALRGYMTKYDCSSADLNPIGGICKNDLKRMMAFIAGRYQVPILSEIASAPPTAELRPLENGAVTQLDEEEMGMTYEELGRYGHLRKIEKCGPVRMYLKLVEEWGQRLSPSAIADKVKTFFRFYSINRHKLTTLTPSYHAEGYSPDDNRFDLRPFLYNVRWTRQFNTIDSIVQQQEQRL